MPLDGLKPIAELAADKPHGNRIKYMAGCRCLPCRAANSRYSVECEARKRRGEGNGLIDPAEAIAHIRALSKKGVGYKAVCEAAGIGKSSVMEMIAGRRKKIRASHARAILAVTPEMAIRDHALIDARPTWKLIRWLMSEGMTKTAIAQRLGYSRALQLGKRWITAKNASKVERLVTRMKLGE